jgi:fimbrial chaperone protein
MQIQKFRLPCALSILLLVGCQSQAFTLIPISATLAPKGYGVATSFRVENESSNRIAFQITMITRDMDELGEETQRSASNLFTVFPPQGVIPPGQRQNIRLVWKGPADPTNELAYRIVAEELPVNFEPETRESHIKMLVRYLGTVYIRPNRVKSKLQTIDLVKAPGNSAETNLYELTLANTGGAHQGLINCELTITNGTGQNTLLKAAQLDTVEGQNILAQHRRRFLIQLPAELREPKYPASLKVDE